VTQRNKAGARAAAKDEEIIPKATYSAAGADNEIINNIDAISNILNKQFFNNDLND
jgi:hypothetical protein